MGAENDAWKIRVHATSSKSAVQYSFIGGGWVAILLSAIILAAIYLPYCIVLLTGSMNPVLPFVSQAAGSPPQSGIFSILLSLTSIVCFVGLHVMHMVIRMFSEGMEIKTSKDVVTMLNKAILIPGHVGILGILIVGGYPFDFHRHNEDWLYVAIIPHFIGALSLFIGGISYCILMTYMMSVIRPEEKELRSYRLLLISVIVFCGALHAATIYSTFMREYYDPLRLKQCFADKVNYDAFYMVCSVSEWIMITGFVFFFYTLRHEGQQIIFNMTVTLNETAETTSKKQLNKMETVKQNTEEKKGTIKKLNTDK